MLAWQLFANNKERNEIREREDLRPAFFVVEFLNLNFSCQLQFLDLFHYIYITVEIRRIE